MSDAAEAPDPPTRTAAPSTLPMKGREAQRLFGFSIAYLFLLFAALLGEHLAGVRPLGLLR